MSAPWNYDDDPALVLETRAPSWECPEGLCECHPRTSVEQTEYSIMLCDADGTRMSNARCRILSNGKVINHDEPHADEHGWLTFVMRRPLRSVTVEWAPASMPAEPQYPHRSAHLIDISPDDDLKSARCRLHNLGFTGGLDEAENVRRFQRRHDYTEITGNLEHILPELREYHDESLYPVVENEPPPQVDPAEGIEFPLDDRASFAAPPSPSTASQGVRPTPRAQKAKAPLAPESKGYPKSGGGSPQGRGTAAPTRHDHIRLRFCARFAHDAKLTRRWADDSHFHQMKETTATLDINRLRVSISKKSPTKGAFFVDKVGVKRDLSLASFHSKKTAQTETAMGAFPRLHGRAAEKNKAISIT